MLGSGVAILQTPVLDGLSFDPFPFQQDGLAAPEVDIGGREVIQALVVALVVVVLDEDAELGFEIDLPAFFGPATGNSIIFASADWKATRRRKRCAPWSIW